MLGCSEYYTMYQVFAVLLTFLALTSGQFFGPPQHRYPPGSFFDPSIFPTASQTFPCECSAEPVGDDPQTQPITIFLVLPPGSVRCSESDKMDPNLNVTLVYNVINQAKPIQPGSVPVDTIVPSDNPFNIKIVHTVVNRTGPYGPRPFYPPPHSHPHPEGRPWYRGWF